jgi:uncharacterized protein (DUF302 family)
MVILEVAKTALERAMNSILFIIAGIAIGAVATAIAVKQMMRKKMVLPERCSGTFEDTCAAIEREVPGAEGWSFPIESFDMGAKLASKQALPESVRRIQLYFLCNPSVAKRVLGDTPKLSAIMPCSWSVYELADGSVWLAHMNIGMMSKVMGGVVGDAMGEVARTDDRLLESITNTAAN